jgi:hypothetical protein
MIAKKRPLTSALPLLAVLRATRSWARGPGAPSGLGAPGSPCPYIRTCSGKDGAADAQCERAAIYAHGYPRCGHGDALGASAPAARTRQSAPAAVPQAAAPAEQTAARPRKRSTPTPNPHLTSPLSPTPCGVRSYVAHREPTPAGLGPRWCRGANPAPAFTKRPPIAMASPLAAGGGDDNAKTHNFETLLF